MSGKPQAVITGVLGGIGKALGLVFQQQGYEVIGLDIRSPNELENAVFNEFIQFDLQTLCNDPDYRQRMHGVFSKKVLRPKVIINNAAVQLLGHVGELAFADWEETLAVNLSGPFLLVQYFLPQLEQNGGSVVNIASIHHQLTKPRFTAYATSKSALVGMTKAMAVDLKDRIRINAISPAAIETDMLRAGFDNDESALDQLRVLHPAQRIGYPEEVAKLAVFLASDDAHFITGGNFTLDGGISSVLHDL